MIVLISTLLGYAIGTNTVVLKWQAFRPIVSIQSKTPPAGQSIDMTLFYDVLSKLNEQFYDKEKIDNKKILYGAISGMLQSLDDPYTSFFPPKENSEFKTQLSGEFQGIGAELIASSDGRIIVVAPLDDTPAAKAGVKSGDTILKVNDESVSGKSLSEVVDKIRGPRGTLVALNIVHLGAAESVNISIKRDVITIKSASGWVKNISCSSLCIEDKNGKSISYIRLSQFGDKTNEEWSALINDTVQKINNNKNFKGIILDLRNNPGGYLNDAVFIASEFIKTGVVVKQEDTNKKIVTMDVSRKGLLTEYPVIVLMNGGSASASEIVAGALADHKRAVLVGEKSFGKGTVQQAVDVDSGASVHISVAKWLTPNGTWVDKKGLSPDIEVKFSQDQDLSKTPFDNQLTRAIKELLKN